MSDAKDVVGSWAGSRRSVLSGAAKLAGGGALAAALLGTAAARGGPRAYAQAFDVLQPAQPDPQMQAVLDTLAELNPLPIETLTPRQARELPSFAGAVLGTAVKQGKPAVEAVGSVRRRLIPGGPGSDGTLIRIYAPVGSGPYPVLVYFHGGGFVIANLDTYDASCRALTNAAGCLVVSVAYRQAPEYRYPAAYEDAFAAYQWVRENAASINGDPNRVAVGGESAGGNLAAVTALLARDRGARLPAHQTLVYPVADIAGALGYPSANEHVDAKPLNTAALVWFGGYYLPTEVAAMEPTASPLLAPSLAGLPPATVIAAQIDPLHDQVQAYADALKAAGNRVTYRSYDGVTHEFFGAAGVIDKAKEAEMLAATELRASFGG